MRFGVQAAFATLLSARGAGDDLPSFFETPAPSTFSWSTRHPSSTGVRRERWVGGWW